MAADLVLQHCCELVASMLRASENAKLAVQYVPSHWLRERVWYQATPGLVGWWPVQRSAHVPIGGGSVGRSPLPPDSCYLELSSSSLSQLGRPETAKGDTAQGVLYKVEGQN
ncbi:hypothetical protein JZ751_018432 [Albula glossodonta]|uniref:Uncharacterized protein n=1 Tax=Albula glossodonta TaxID=121402 RepID=A0A8T2MTI5_9TELE|nr:hypothetical protein JZ751_018432 [Albula glossodonta]